MIERISGHGIDLVSCHRFEKTLNQFGQRLLNRLFLQAEQDYCLRQRNAHIHFAARFAAKEALSKALGTGIGPELGWQDIEIIRQDSGQPDFRFHGKGQLQLTKRAISRCWLSLSHTRDHAIASVILVHDENP